eukprot:SAG31_NODE_1863_length_7037_cov_2.325742_3_plen_65_part_00
MNVRTLSGDACAEGGSRTHIYSLEVTAAGCGKKMRSDTWSLLPSGGLLLPSREPLSTVNPVALP